MKPTIIFIKRDEEILTRPILQYLREEINARIKNLQQDERWEAVLTCTTYGRPYVAVNEIVKQGFWVPGLKKLADIYFETNYIYNHHEAKFIRESKDQNYSVCENRLGHFEAYSYNQKSESLLCDSLSNITQKFGLHNPIVSRKNYD